MAYSFQTFSVSQVLTAAQMNQVEINIRDHQHGLSSGVSTTIGTLLPDADNTRDLGSSSFRLANVWAVNGQWGDATFANGWKITEDGDRLMFINPIGRKVLLLETNGDFIKGDHGHV